MTSAMVTMVSVRIAWSNSERRVN